VVEVLEVGDEEAEREACTHAEAILERERARVEGEREVLPRTGTAVVVTAFAPHHQFLHVPRSVCSGGVSKRIRGEKELIMASSIILLSFSYFPPSYHIPSLAHFKSLLS
jgi:hypothetical protein